MASLEDKIKDFVAVGYGSGHGYGDGHGFGYGDGSGSGYGDGHGDGHGDGYDDGYDEGSGYGFGFGYCDGSGDGDGFGYGDGYGFGYCEGDGYGLKSLNGLKVYYIDNVPTVITYIHGNVAEGFIVNKDFTVTPCFVVKEKNKFAHGETLRDAMRSLQEKLYDDSTEEERLNAFKEKFPEYDTPYPNENLFAYHHVLTRSCLMGRKQFVKDNGLTLNGETTVREFVKLTENAYGGKIIKELKKMY